MSSIIEDYKAIADRQRDIAIMEGYRLCTRCQNTGFHEYWDEEGGAYYTECEVCRNPLKRKPPTYQG